MLLAGATAREPRRAIDASIGGATVLTKKARTPAVVAAGKAATEPTYAVQAAVEAEYAPEIGRFEQVFAAAARDAASESTDGQDDDSIDERRAAAAAPGPAPANRRQRRAATKKKKKGGGVGGGFGGN